MVTDGHVRKLRRLLFSGRTLTASARMTGMDEKTARTYRDQGASEAAGSRAVRPAEASAYDGLSRASRIVGNGRPIPGLLGNSGGSPGQALNDRLAGDDSFGDRVSEGEMLLGSLRFREPAEEIELAVFSEDGRFATYDHDDDLLDILANDVGGQWR